MGSLGGEPVSVFAIASRQNCRRINPIVCEDVVSGIKDNVEFRARRAMYAGRAWLGMKVLRVYEGRSYFLPNRRIRI
jgi:hypothetical protein